MSKTLKSVVVGSLYETNSSGMIEVVSIFNYKKVKIKFLETGNIRIATAGSIRKGEVKDLIYGIGYCDRKVSTKNADGTIKKSYDAWRRLLYRCTEPWWLLHPTYRGTSVCKAWHCYTPFAKWFEDNTYGDGLEVEKDLLVLGNKEYSPDTCCLVTNSINKAIIIRKEHLGVNKKGNVFEVYFRSKYIGSSKNIVDAQKTYMGVKVEYVKSLALSCKSLDPRVKEALLNFNLSINSKGFIERVS